MTVPMLEIIYIGAVAWGLVQFIGMPLLENSLSMVEEAQDPVVLAERKQGLLVAIKELEFDREMGKLNEQEYHAVRTKLEAETIEVMKALDALKGAAPAEAAPKEEAEKVETPASVS